MRWFVLICGSVLAVLILKYRRPIKEFTGNIGFAERIFGMGGTNTFIVVLGILVFVGSLLYFTGTLQGIVNSVVGPLF